MLYPIILLLISFFASAASAQTAAALAPGWQALRSDDGELSLALPAACRQQIYVREGFQLNDRSLGQMQRVRDLRSVTCYEHKTLLGVDVYTADLPAAALRLMRRRSPETGVESKLPAPLDGVRFVNDNEKFVAERRLIVGRRHIYVLTAAVRAGAPDETMKRFWASVRMRSEDEARKAPDERAKPLSTLPEFVPELVFAAAGEAAKKTSLAAPPSSPTAILAPLVLYRAVPGWTREATRQRTRGEARLRLILSPAGSLGKIEVLRDPGGGLLREAVLAALQSKMLPAERQGSPRAAEMQFAYKYRSR